MIENEDFFVDMAIIGNTVAQTKYNDVELFENWLDSISKALKLKEPPKESYYGILRYMEKMGSPKN